GVEDIDRILRIKCIYNMKQFESFGIHKHFQVFPIQSPMFDYKHLEGNFVKWYGFQNIKFSSFNVQTEHIHHSLIYGSQKCVQWNTLHNGRLIYTISVLESIPATVSVC